MKFWMIVNVDNLEDINCMESRIPKCQVPSFIHFDKDRAIQELFRLKSKDSDVEFYLLESVGMVERITDTDEYKYEEVDE